MKNTKMKKEYGLLGQTLKHSYSPNLHKIIGGYEYDLIEIKENNLADFMEKRSFKGINVTIPYKEQVMAYLDEVSPLAKEIGAVNTVVNNNGKLIGYNTDYYGFDYMCKLADISLKDQKVLILGSGGASKMVQTYARINKAKKIVVISRKTENNYKNLYKWYDFTCIINTTPVGMYPDNDSSIIDLTPFKKCEMVIDLIYNPLRTNLILQAQKLGIKTATGLSMLVGQAYQAAQLFLDKKLSLDLMNKALNKMQAEIENIIFIGMPGVGKTTIAKMLAECVNKKLILMDEIIEERNKKTIAEIFANDGEDSFRNLENMLTKEIAKEKNLIIATGGGTPVYLNNAQLLKQNGLFIYLKRPLVELSRKGRPLSKDLKSLEKMYKQRNPIYEELADEIIFIKKDKKETLANVLKVLRKRGF